MSGALQVADAGSLLAALHDAPSGSTIEIAAERLDLSGTVEMRRPLHLRPALGFSPILRLHGAWTTLVVTAGAGGGGLSGLTLEGCDFRNEPLLRLLSPPGFRLEEVSLRQSDGAALLAEDCEGLRLRNLRILEIGLTGATFAGCSDLSGEIDLAGIGRRARSPAVQAGEGRGVELTVRARDVSGNALTLKPGLDGARIGVEAARAFRALAVLGEAERPISDLVASVAAEDVVDCAVLMNNARSCSVAVASRACASPVRLGGATGVRGCAIAVTCDVAKAVEASAGSRDNCVTQTRAPDTDAFRAPSSVAASETDAVAETCTVCGWSGAFRRTFRMVRETYACGACRATLRYRAQAFALLTTADEPCRTLKELAEGPWLTRLSVYEPGVSGPFRPYLRKAGRYVTSGYWPGAAPGETRNGVEHQDLTATTFADGSFDLVVTSDIMEHVRRPREAWREIRRILKPGGRHVFSIPTAHPPSERTVARVDTSGPDDRHILPPQYHGDGQDGLSLVYTDFGADLIDELATLGLPTRIVPYPSANPECAAAISFVSSRA